MINARTRITALPGLAVAAFSSQILATSCAAAQATPETGNSELIELRVEADGVKGMPSSVPAGRYTVQVSSPTPAVEDGIGVLFAILPEGTTPQQALEAVETADPYPEWFFNAYFGGGVNLQYEASEGWGIVDLIPGNWIVTSLGARTLAVEFEVTGEFPANVAPPEVQASIELDEMTITVADGQLAASEMVIEVCNVGEQIHHLSFVKVPNGTTHEQVQALWDSYLSGTPDANALAETDTIEVAYFAELSPEACEWGPLTLESGTYVLSCFVGDPEMGGMPHAFMGMWDLITVE